MSHVHIHVVHSGTKYNRQLKRNGTSKQKIYFLTFLDISTADTNYFLQCPSHFWNTLVDSSLVRVWVTPSYFVLNSLQGPSSGLLAPSSVRGREISLQAWGLGSKVDGEPVGFLFLTRNVWAFLVSGNRSLVRVEHPLPRHQVRPYLVKSLQELPKGTVNVIVRLGI